MIIPVLLLGLLLLLVSFAAFEQQKDWKKKAVLLRWVDEREFFQKRLSEAVQNLRNLGAVEHINQIDGVWNARFGPNGPKTFIPSATGLKQFAVAQSIMKEREGYYVQIRDRAQKAYNNLKAWELTHPMPDPGLPYDEPPRPVKMPEPKQHPKPAPRAFLDAPIYNKELTR